MKIYTSYFANLRKLGESNIMPIGIALYPPKWFNGVSVQMVSPTHSILKGSRDEDDYTKRFRREVLSRVDAKRFIEILERHSSGRDVALCCFEKPEDFCHRHIVAEWLKEQLGIEVEEFGQVKSKNEAAVQGSLF